jgi:hypothetical protein
MKAWMRPSPTELFVDFLFPRYGTGLGSWRRHWPVDGVCARVWGAQFHFTSQASTRSAAAHGVMRAAAMAAFAKAGDGNKPPR